MTHLASVCLLLAVALSSTFCAESRRLRLLPSEDDKPKKGEEDFINLPTCGKSTVGGSRVVAGTDASLGEWPWQAKILTEGTFTCGGSLITPSWVMTAAHCIFKKDPSLYSVTLGDLHREKPEGSEQEFRVKKVVVHPKYNWPVVINNDIALLQLTRSAKKNSFVNTVCLPDEAELVPVGTKCYISGWGQMTHPDSAAIKLQQAPMPVVSNRDCQAKHTDSTASKPGESAVTSAMICAGDAGKTKISGCFGDSGGPFVCQNSAGQWVQQGIVSWGDTTCSSKAHFTVFARVSVFRKWIEDQLSE